MTCQECNGTGVQVSITRLGPGMVQQMQTVCSECGGKKETINPKLRCKTCMGKKTYQAKKILEVHIDKGKLVTGDSAVFSFYSYLITMQNRCGGFG